MLEKKKRLGTRATRNEHRHFALVFKIGIAEFSHEIPFLEHASDNDPERPEDIEQQSVPRQIRA